MDTNDTYEGWTNKETWAVALHINNDQGWQEVRDALRDGPYGSEGFNLAEARTAYFNTGAHYFATYAGDIIRQNVEETLTPVELDLDSDFDGVHFNPAQWLAMQDIGSMWRVDWDQLGAAFLADLDEA